MLNISTCNKKNLLFYSTAIATIFLISLLTLSVYSTPISSSVCEVIFGNIYFSKYVTYSSLLLFSLLNLVYLLILKIIILLALKDVLNLSYKNVFGFILFILLGIFASTLINNILILDNYKITLKPILSYYISSCILLFYTFSLYLLFCGKIDKNKHIREIYLFILVGLAASLTDFLFTSLVKYYSSNLDELLSVFLSVSVGFTFGVIVNYLLSFIYVFPKSKKFKNKQFEFIIFVLFAIFGFLIGLGVELIINNEYIYILKPYFLVFIIRTIAVLIFNYLTRKYIIFKKKEGE